MNKFTSLLFFIALVLTACSQNKESQSSETEEITNAENVGEDNYVYNYSDSVQFKEFLTKELDATHPNLLNPKVAQESYEEVIKEWQTLHNELSEHLDDVGFSWNTSDSSVAIFHKIYFDSTGQIKHHFFNVLSASISDSIKNVFGEQLENFGEQYQIDLKRSEPFAQCGKARYTINTEN